MPADAVAATRARTLELQVKARADCLARAHVPALVADERGEAQVIEEDDAFHSSSGRRSPASPAVLPGSRRSQPLPAVLTSVCS